MAALYLYRTFIVTDDTDFIGLTAGQKTQHETDKLDFETNFKTLTNIVDDYIVADTTFIVEESYTSFKSRITGSVLWSDVKVIEKNNRYLLHLLT